MVKKMVEKNVSDFEQEKEQIPTTKTNQNQTSVVCCFRLFLLCFFFFYVCLLPTYFNNSM